MRLDSVRALKEQFAFSQRRAAGAGFRPTLGLGAAPRDGEDYLLAVHVQDHRLLQSPLLGEIREAARGEVDIRYVGRLVKRTDPRRRVRPLHIGLSIGHYAITAGTVGGFVRHVGSDEWFVLSNNHVLANENRGQIGDEVIQPGRADGGRSGDDRIGALTHFVELDPSAANKVDCALAAIDEAIEIDPTSLPGLGRVSGTASSQEAASIERVAKLGRTSGLTFGTVIAIEMDIVVEFDIGLLKFEGQIAVRGTADRPFSEGGDSGSLIVTADDHRAVSLLFCGREPGEGEAEDVTYGNLIGDVLTELHAEVPW
jgi:hypothetical protein